MYKYICFFKQEKPEMDDFEETNVLKEKHLKFQYHKKIFWKMFKILTDTHAKMSKNTFAYSFVSEHSKHFFKNNLHFLAAGGVDPLPPPP